MLAADGIQFLVFDEVIRIHEIADSLHKKFDECAKVLQTRRCGVGFGGIAHEREADLGADLGQQITARKQTLREHADFVVEVFPFVYGLIDSPLGTPKPPRKLCTEAICCLLGVSKIFLYGRKRTTRQCSATDEELTSIVDNSGVRMRQLRR